MWVKFEVTIRAGEYVLVWFVSRVLLVGSRVPSLSGESADIDLQLQTTDSVFFVT